MVATLVLLFIGRRLSPFAQTFVAETSTAGLHTVYFEVASSFVEPVVPSRQRLDTMHQQDVENYPPKRTITGGQDDEATFDTGSYGYDQSQVGIVRGRSAPKGFFCVPSAVCT